jgi:hypothetical protein
MRSRLITENETGECPMALFKKTDEHAGSGIDKPNPKGIVEKLADKVKAATAPTMPIATPVAADKRPISP